MMYRALLIVLLGLLGAQGYARADIYKPDMKSSYVTFTGKHAGEEFTGIFQEWTADIVFDAADLKASRVKVVFDMESATTDNKMYDGTLPQKDWFNVKAYKEATFESTSFEDKGDGLYTVTGDLTIRDVTKPVSFDFKLSDLNRSDVIMDASVVIDRLAYGIGLKSDPDMEWVDKDILITIHLSTTIQ